MILLITVLEGRHGCGTMLRRGANLMRKKSSRLSPGRAAGPRGNHERHDDYAHGSQNDYAAPVDVRGRYHAAGAPAYGLGSASHR